MFSLVVVAFVLFTIFKIAFGLGVAAKAIRSGKTGCKVFILIALIKLLVAVFVLYQGKEYAVNHFNLCPSTAPPDVRQIVSCPNITPPVVDEVQPPVRMPPLKSPDESQPVSSSDETFLSSHPGIQATADARGPYKPRVMCMIFTTPADILLKAWAVNDTWAKRCDFHRFFVSGINISQAAHWPDVVAMPVPEGRDHLTGKTNFALRYSYLHFKDSVDWFLKADDDTYIVMENLKWTLSFYDPDKSNYIGYRSNEIIPHGYNGGGAGYSLSRMATRLMVEEAHRFPANCHLDGGMEDLDMGNCLSKFNIHPPDTKDYLERLTFHPDHPYKIFANQGDARSVYTYRKHADNPSNFPSGIRVLSPYTVSLHYMDPGHMYMYDFFLYDIQRKWEFVAGSETLYDKDGS